MKKFFLFIVLLVFPIPASAQASGGQIRRKTVKQRVENTPIPIHTEKYEVNGVSFSMVQIDGGTFTMGMTKDRAKKTGNNDAAPAHKVTLSSFKMSTTEVTYELWEAVMGSKHYSQPNKGGKKKPVQTTWKYSLAFFKKLSELTGKTFRHPTEAEWEFAAKGGTISRGYKYPGSNSANEVAWISQNSGFVIHEVGKKKPNELGLYDMCGNVDEWCYDWYAPYSAETQINPYGPDTGKGRGHIYRGGNISCGGDVHLPEARHSDFCDYCEWNTQEGIRLVLSDIIFPIYETKQTKQDTQSDQIITRDKLKKYNIVVCSYTNLSDAKQTFQDLNDNGFFSNIYLDSSSTYRVLMYMGTGNLYEARDKRDKAREKYPDAWILKVENGHEYKVE